MLGFGCAKRLATIALVATSLSSCSGSATPTSAQSTQTPAVATAATVVPSSTAAPTITAATQPDWAADGYLNLLLLGIDSTAGLGSYFTDSILLLQVEISSGRAAMYGFPRNMTNVSLPAEWASAYDCGCFPSGLSALLGTAVRNPSRFPKPGLSDTQRGLVVLEETIGGLSGVKVDGTLAINMPGLVKLVDALGGVSINVPTGLVDKAYPKLDGSGLTTVNIPAGQQHMDGLTALAYVRSRKSDSDYARMQRQQILLGALRAGFQPCSLGTHLAPVLQALGDMLWTDLPIEDAPGLAALAEKTSVAALGNTLFTPMAGYPTAIVAEEVQKIQAAVAHGMDAVPASGSSGGSAGPAC